MISKQRINALNTYLTHLGVSMDTVDQEALERYNRALTHSSYTYEHKLSPLENYERLEFLGDAVLKIVISNYLFQRFPQYREGDLTKIRAVIVSDAVLSKFSQQVGLGEQMVFGPNEAKMGGSGKVSNLACAFEAFLGALYLNGQQDFITQFLETLVADEVTKVDLSKTKDNYKAVLQEFTQGEGDGLPTYQTIKEVGPPHNKTFTIEVSINGEVVGMGEGKSKKEAQQQAAKVALRTLNELGENET